MKQCASFKRNSSGQRRCARFINTNSEGGPDVDTSMHRGGFAGLLGTSIKLSDLGIGAGVGLAGSLGFKWVVNRWLVTTLPAGVIKFIPALGAGLSAAAVYFLSGKHLPQQRKLALAAGAAFSGVLVNGWDLFKAKFPQYGDLVAVDVPGYGYLVNDPSGATMPQLHGMGGIVIDEGNPRMNELAYSALGEPEPDYIEYGY